MEVPQNRNTKIDQDKKKIATEAHSISGWIGGKSPSRSIIPLVYKQHHVLLHFVSIHCIR